jgi:hypothetical protein
MKKRLVPLERLLSGGDLRSIGGAAAAMQDLLEGLRSPEEFVRLIEDGTPVVRMRAADALEKATRSSPQLVSGAADWLLGLLSSTQSKEVRWHLLQMAPRINWQRTRHAALLSAVERAFSDESAIVQASALQALAELASQSAAFEDALRRRLPWAAESALPSLRARARKLAGRNAA